MCQYFCDCRSSLPSLIGRMVFSLAASIGLLRKGFGRYIRSLSYSPDCLHGIMRKYAKTQCANTTKIYVMHASLS